MGIEIERKFLVKGDFRSAATSCTHMVQAYLCTDKNKSVRVRVVGDKAFLTIKGRSHDGGLSRYEFEHAISHEEGLSLLQLCTGPRIEKSRWLVPQGDLCFEVDVFEGENQGLVVAEIELPTVAHTFDRPDWLGEEVTGQAQYYNSALTLRPYTTWEKAPTQAVSSERE